MAVNDTMDNRNITSWDLENTDLANLDGFLGVAEEQNITSCECGFHALTRVRVEKKKKSAFDVSERNKIKRGATGD